MTRIEGAVAIVTGASSGIGRCLALDLAQAGATVALVARRKDRLAEVEELARSRGEAVGFAADVRDISSLGRVVDAVLQRFGTIDILVNNAGVGRYLTLLEHSQEDIDEIIATNLLAPVNLIRMVLPQMLERKAGHIVNVSSIAGRIGSPYHTIYCATKFGLAGFSESLSFELEGTGVGLTLVNPGVIDTEFFSHSSFSRYPKGAKKRMISAEEVSRAILKAIENGTAEITIPRSYAAGTVLKTLAPGLFKRLLRFALREAEGK